MREKNKEEVASYYRLWHSHDEDLLRGTIPLLDVDPSGFGVDRNINKPTSSPGM